MEACLTSRSALGCMRERPSTPGDHQGPAGCILNQCSCSLQTTHLPKLQDVYSGEERAGANERHKRRLARCSELLHLARNRRALHGCRHRAHAPLRLEGYFKMLLLTQAAPTEAFHGARVCLRESSWANRASRRLQGLHAVTNVIGQHHALQLCFARDQIWSGLARHAGAWQTVRWQGLHAAAIVTHGSPLQPVLRST